MSKSLIHGLQQATESVRAAHPSLTDKQVGTAYERFADHFENTPDDDPPVSYAPDEDALLLALWDVIVDRELAGADDTDDLNGLYVTAFGELAGRDRESDETMESPTASEPIALPIHETIASRDPAPTSDENADTGEMTPGDGQSSDRQVYRIKVTLDGSRPPIWRRILVMADATLDQLHHVIQSAMGWTESHMHQFYPDAKRDLPSTRPPRLADVFKNIDDHCGYEYDFGDSWYHDLELERVETAETGRDYPICIAGQRACPPEDVGGIPGYEHMLEILKNPNHPEYEEMAGWLTQDFNPNAFSTELANQRLSRHGQVRFRPAD